MPGCVLSFVEMLLPVVLGLLKGVDASQGDAQLRKRCVLFSHVNDLLLDILHIMSTRLFSTPLWDSVCL